MRKKAGSISGQNISNNLRPYAILMIVSALLIPSVAESQRAQPLNCVGGSIDAPIRLEVYSDFQCPACARFFLEVVTPAVKEYGDSGKICVLYNEFPLNGHKYSREAARYSLAAQRLGRRQWLAVIRALYQKQPMWVENGNIDGALRGVVSAGDLARIKRIAGEPSIRDAVSREVALGEKREIRSTPTIFVTAHNKTQKIEQLMPYEVWKDYFDDNLK